MNLKKITSAMLAAVCLCGLLTGCTTSKNGQGAEKSDAEQAAAAERRATKEVQLNDYRGGVIRTGYLKDFVIAAMENMKTNNAKLRTDNPNSFWTTEGYQDFVVNLLSIPIISDSQWFNEEETTWEDVLAQMSSVESSFTTKSDNGYALKAGITIQHNEKDDYAVLGVPVSKYVFSPNYYSTSNVTVDGVSNYRFLYDSDKDWCKAYAALTLSNQFINPITQQMFEYARLDDNTFAIQTSRERLLVVLAPVEQDTDFRERTVREFYYSKLTQDGMRTTFEPYVPIAEYDEETGKLDQDAASKNRTLQSYKIFNDKGDVAVLYGKNDSMFLTDDIAKNIGTEWVFEDKSLQQAICYKDKCLVVTTYNKLTEKYERFTYSADTVKDADIQKLEALVSIEGLVGEQEIPDIEIPEVNPEDFKKEETTPAEPADSDNAAEPEASDETPADAVDDAANSELDAMREQANQRQDGDSEAAT